MVKMIKSDATQQEIADKLGMSQQAVSKSSQKANIRQMLLNDAELLVQHLPEVHKEFMAIRERLADDLPLLLKWHQDYDKKIGMGSGNTTIQNQYNMQDNSQNKTVVHADVLEALETRPQRMEDVFEGEIIE